MSSFRFSNHDNQYRFLESRAMSWLEKAIVECARLSFSGLLTNSFFWCICKFLDAAFPKNPIAFLDVVFLPMEIFFIIMVGVMAAVRMLFVVMSKD